MGWRVGREGGGEVEPGSTQQKCVQTTTQCSHPEREGKGKGRKAKCVCKKLLGYMQRWEKGKGVGEGKVPSLFEFSGSILIRIPIHPGAWGEAVSDWEA